MFNRTGFHYTSRYDSMIAKTMSDRPKKFYAPIKKSTTPGPGSYDVFSDFCGYSDNHRKCKCGRRLGHPPVTEGDTPCDEFGKTINVNENRKFKNLKIKLDDNSEKNSNSQNKNNKNKDIRYKTIS